MEPTSRGHVVVLQATTDEQIVATREVMGQLRPNIPSDAYLSTVRRMFQTDGYQLVALYDAGRVRAVAGYRFMEMLYCGSRTQGLRIIVLPRKPGKMPLFHTDVKGRCHGTVSLSL